MNVRILKREKGQEIRLPPTSLEEVKDIISVYGPDTRYMVQKGQELIFIFIRPNN